MDMEYWERRGPSVLKDSFSCGGKSWFKCRAHLKKKFMTGLLVFLRMEKGSGVVKANNSTELGISIQVLVICGTVLNRYSCIFSKLSLNRCVQAIT